MYGGAPFGSVAYGALLQTESDGPLPEPSGGGSFMLMGIRSLLFAILAWAAA